MKKQFILYDFKKTIFSEKLSLESLRRLEKQGLIELKKIDGKLYFKEIEEEEVQDEI